jgi:hypothetical protein
MAIDLIGPRRGWPRELGDVLHVDKGLCNQDGNQGMMLLPSLFMCRRTLEDGTKVCPSASLIWLPDWLTCDFTCMMCRFPTDCIAKSPTFLLADGRHCPAVGETNPSAIVHDHCVVLRMLLWNE